MGEILWAVDYTRVQNTWVENRGFTPAFFIFSQKDKKEEGYLDSKASLPEITHSEYIWC
jgi:hypothetical protein